MELTIEKTVTFEAAHSLPRMPAGHKCRHLHGHTYTLTVGVRGEVDREGIVWDFGELKSLIQNRVLNKLDHKTLNDIVGNPTAENLVAWIVNELELPAHLTLMSIVLSEGHNNATKWS